MNYTVNIAGSQVKISLIDVEYFEVDGVPAAGLFTASPLEISVATKGRTEEELKPIILHEILHAIFYISGLWQDLGTRTEELICANMESFLPPLIEFKKKAFKKIVKKRRG